MRRHLGAAGWKVRLGKPGPDDWVGIWGASPTSYRGLAIARATGARVLRIEDAFLRSLFPGRAGEIPFGLLFDKTGVHFDAAAPSDLEHILQTAPLDDEDLLARARSGIARMIARHLTKYAAVDPDLPLPDPGFVLIVDQSRGDASLPPDDGMFHHMLARARADHPGAQIVIKSHPETRSGFRRGHFGVNSLRPGDVIFDAPASPWTLLARARAVYTVSSQMGFEAILAGHRPTVFGQPFYAGWGLSEDQLPCPRRTRTLAPEQLFAAAMMIAPVWVDPYSGKRCDVEQIMDAMEVQARAWRDDRNGYRAIGMKRWKHAHIRAYFGQHGPVRFSEGSKTSLSASTPMVWGDAECLTGGVRIEDGYIRSNGLGAALIPPISVVTDRQGLACDPNRPSDLEDLIAESTDLASEDLCRAEQLIATLRKTGVTKYGAGDRTMPELPMARRVLVVGQVSDDISVRLGCTGEAKSDGDLLDAARAANPDAALIFKPHPDVLKGYRNGLKESAVADVVLDNCDPAAAIEACDEVWTLTSTLGFEALIRAKRVTCLGMPFYAGWGLTNDCAAVPARRRGGITLPGLVYASLIAYPRYLDPVTGLPCPVEVAVTRLISGETYMRSSPARSILSSLQGARRQLRQI